MTLVRMTRVDESTQINFRYSVSIFSFNHLSVYALNLSLSFSTVDVVCYSRLSYRFVASTKQ